MKIISSHWPLLYSVRFNVYLGLVMILSCHNIICLTFAAFYKPKKETKKAGLSEVDKIGGITLLYNYNFHVDDIDFQKRNVIYCIFYEVVLYVVHVIT